MKEAIVTAIVNMAENIMKLDKVEDKDPLRIVRVCKLKGDDEKYVHITTFATGDKDLMERYSKEMKGDPDYVEYGF